MTLATDIATAITDISSVRGNVGGQVSNLTIAALLALIYQNPGGGGGGGATAAEIKTAIETATNLDTLETLLALTKGAGTVDSTTLRATLASDGTLMTLLTARLPAQPTVARYVGSSAGAAAKGSAGNILGLYACNENSANRYLQLFNLNVAPSGGATPLISYLLFGSGGQIILDSAYFAGAGLAFSTGIAWGFSSTKTTYTAATASDCVVEVLYS
jgi:hypothetical protein